MLPVAAAAKAISFSGKAILDLTAAPGGKATHAAELASDGLVVSNEVISSRVQPLIWNSVRHRIPNPAITCASPAHLASLLPNYFDIILVDAPCSGEGLFQKRKHSLNRWSEKNIHFNARRQRSILLEAAKLIKPEGFLVYSTCTFAPEENEEQTAWLLDMGWLPVAFPEEISVSAAISPRQDVALCSRRIMPHQFEGSGSFVSLLQAPDDFSYPVRQQVFVFFGNHHLLSAKC
ncbi:MAG: RsmB/NOP family class I SAM-dependent RNA methyltransferase [Candidatus Cloacimonetes bacterium]|nr:RsmB/NOP family class I SAM-dependent RNA methyltransferase [Candidatus Cloacimonadota bacterium]